MRKETLLDDCYQQQDKIGSAVALVITIKVLLESLSLTFDPYPCFHPHFHIQIMANKTSLRLPIYAKCWYLCFPISEFLVKVAIHITELLFSTLPSKQLRRVTFAESQHSRESPFPPPLPLSHVPFATNFDASNYIIILPAMFQ